MSIAQPIVPILSLPSTVLFPHALLEIKVAEGQYDCAIGEWLAEGALWGIATLRGEGRTHGTGRIPAPIHRTLGIGYVVHLERENRQIRRLVLEGLLRARIVDNRRRPGVAAVEVEVLRDVINVEGPRRQDLARLFAEMVGTARHVAALEAKLRDPVRQALSRHLHPGVIADLLTHHCVRDVYARQSILTELDVARRVRLVQVQLAQLVRQQSLQPLRRFR